jgi:hypothetical protein
MLTFKQTAEEAVFVPAVPRTSQMPPVSGIGSFPSENHWNSNA